MKDFNEFEEYVKEHGLEVVYDMIHRDGTLDGINITENEAFAIMRITYSTILAVLRQYHHWME